MHHFSFINKSDYITIASYINTRLWKIMILSIALVMGLTSLSKAHGKRDSGSCQYSIALYDSYGDGWNGCMLDVLVDGVILLDDITLSSGYGPAIFNFPVNTGAQITTAFIPGSYPCEPYYYIYNSDDQQVFFAPNNCNPVINPGQLYGTCPALGTVEGYVFNYDGLAISGATIATATGTVTTSAANGQYLLFPVQAGNTEVSCGKEGFNIVTDIVSVVDGDTVIHNFTLTQPNMVVNPLQIEQTLNPNEYYTTSLNILNNGNGPLNWTSIVNYISQPVLSCQYSINLYDTYGDGWNGCALDVLVNGEVVLDNITLNSGYGPAVFYFDVTTGDEITTAFTPGSWVGEPYYRVYDGQGQEVWYSPAGTAGPLNIQPGQLYAACSGGDWLTMNYYNGSVPAFGGVDNVPTHLDASNTSAGEIYTAEIVVSSSPNVGTITVPVTMIILGSPLSPPENLEVELEDNVNGTVLLTWEWNGDAFQFFMIKRDGAIVGTTTNTNYTDILPDFGTYCYTVQVVYNEGPTAPAGPECVEWPNPDILVDPNDLQGWVWVGYTVDVSAIIYNNGEGTLSYSFPEFAALDLIHNPDIRHNQIGTPLNLREADALKGDESYNGMGFPVVLGAGGPDDFGYVWIDSDESGGPVFTWTDISTTGTVVNGLSDDNVVGPFNLGFEFPFYGENKSQFWVNSNGTIGFTSTYISLGNTGIPTNSSTYKDFIAWMWDDLIFRSGQSMVYYQNYTDKTIVQFSNYGRYGQTGGMWAQVIIYRSGKMMIMYDQLDASLSYNSCSVGIQSSDPGTGLQVVYNNTYLHNDLALMFSLPADFIVDVEPAWGTVAAGDEQPITITYDSEGYDPGQYNQDLLLESNDPDMPEWIINNTMHVYIPAHFSGTVLDNDGGAGLQGVTVTAGDFQAMTDDDGHYSLYVDEGEYDVVFSRLGYMNVSISDTFALHGVVTPIDVGMWDVNYPPSFVTAEVQDNDIWCKVTWTLPQGPYEIGMDDGDADDFILFAHSGSWNAVKFIPSGYPATVIGGKFYVGDGEFPGPFLGTEFGVAVFAADGPNGLPGTMLDSTGVTVNNYGWVSLDWLDVTIESGDFYLAMFQSENAPEAAPLGIDTDVPTYFRSYTKFLSNSWSLSAFQDFMIRAWVSGPEGDAITDACGTSWKATPRIPQGWQQHAMTKSGTLPHILPGYERLDQKYTAVEGMSNRDVQNYRVARYSNFDPNGSPTAGNLNDLGTTGNLQYSDYAWVGLPQGWYAYGVKALYSSGLYSTYAVSNIVGHLMDYHVTVNVTLSTGLEPGGVEITLMGLEWPYESYFAVTPASGQVIIPGVWKGHYNLTAFKIGYELDTISNTLINADQTFNIQLNDKKYPPACLVVDPLTLDATWCKPLRTALDENFEGAEFPPAGWQMTTEGVGWFRTDDGSTGGWTIPPWDSFYACVNDAGNSSMPGCCDYLITPPMDLRESEGYALYFDSYYDGSYGQLAFIEYSLDSGANWEVLEQLSPVMAWTHLEYDLSQFSGMTGPNRVWLAFHADDAGIWASGWAVDNPKVQVPAPAASYLDFYVFLDDVFIIATTETNWNFAPLMYGQEYVASVAALYSSGLSAKDHCRFVCRYLFPPCDLVGYAPDDAAILIWNPPDSTPILHDRELPENLLGYNIYRDEAFVAYKNHVGGMEPQNYVDENLEPGIYDYAVTGVYDLSPYGYPGETGESMEEGPAEVIVDYCYELEFMESWDLGSFDANKWMTDGANWIVSSQSGIPAPAAEFTWDPVQTDYEQSLESYPLCAVDITEGKIWMDYDIKLKVFQATGEEFLKTQVWNWDNRTWTTVAEYSNIDGNFDWTNVHINIRALAMGKVFKVRFLATGMNSLDIVNWSVDNIHIYRICDGPMNLTASVNYANDCIVLNWIEPQGGFADEWIHWDDGVNYSAIGTGSAMEFDVAARWEPSQLIQYDGTCITEVAFFPNESAATYSIRLWIGAGAANLVVDQPVTNPTIGQWNYAVLATPVPIDVTNELWIGYHVNTQAGFPAGCDDGPAIDGYGNMMNFGGWQTLLQINPELDCNWNIEAHVQWLAGATMPLSLQAGTQNIASLQTLSLDPDYTNAGQVFASGSNGSRELTGYNIYLSIDGGEYELIDHSFTNNYDFCDVPNGLYCFMLTAVWESETDQCESALSNEACVIMNVGINDPTAGADNINMYPNPANDHVFISSSNNLNRITVYNVLGQLIDDEIATGRQYNINTTGYSVGVYLVRIETVDALTIKTLTIQR